MYLCGVLRLLVQLKLVRNDVRVFLRFHDVVRRVGYRNAYGYSGSPDLGMQTKSCTPEEHGRTWTCCRGCRREPGTRDRPDRIGVCLHALNARRRCAARPGDGTHANRPRACRLVPSAYNTCECGPCRQAIHADRPSWPELIVLRAHERGRRSEPQGAGAAARTASIQRCDLPR